MTKNKTHPTQKNVMDFLETLEDNKKKEDSLKILEKMKEITNQSPVLWGDSLIGFGKYHYTYKSGREGQYFKIGFSPRKTTISIYLMDRMTNPDLYKQDFKDLGKIKLGKSCLYIKKLENVNTNVLWDIFAKSYKNMNDFILNTPSWESIE